MESERNMSASMASLRAEVTNARAEIEHVREEGEAALAEKEEQIEMEMTQMRAEWEAAVSEEAKLKEKVTELTDALTKVCCVHLSQAQRMFLGRNWIGVVNQTV
jgi:histidinol dehydrogenase